MAEPGIDPAHEAEILERAVWRKWNKFTWSGLGLIVIGLLLIFVGLLLHTGAYSAEGLLIGLGTIIILVGIIRVLIGFINPLSPRDLDPPHHTADRLDAALEEGFASNQDSK